MPGSIAQSAASNAAKRFMASASATSRNGLAEGPAKSPRIQRRMEVRAVVAAGRQIDAMWIAPARTGLPALVLLHEGLGSGGSWRDFPAQLALRTGCGVLVYSRYGNGFSEALREPRSVTYMHDEALIALPEILEGFGLRETILIGHSDGASIATIYACDRAGVRGLVLEAPHVFVEDLSIRSIARAREAFTTGDLRERLARYHVDVDRTFYGWNDIWLDPAFRSWNIEPYAAGVCCPMLLVQGEADEYGTRAQLDAIRRCAGESVVDELLLARCGHAPHRDRPGPVITAVAAFVEALLKA